MHVLQVIASTQLYLDDDDDQVENDIIPISLECWWINTTYILNSTCSTKLTFFCLIYVKETPMIDLNQL